MITKIDAGLSTPPYLQTTVIPPEIVVQIFLKIIPSIKGMMNLALTCKGYWNAKLHADTLWNQTRRTQIIDRLSSVTLKRNQIDDYQTNQLMNYSATQFIHQWLGNFSGSQINPNDLIQKITPLIGENFREFAFIENFITHLLNKEEIEAAFAFGECFQDTMYYSDVVQKNLIRKFGHKKALQLTLAYNNPESASHTYKSFIKMAMQSLSENIIHIPSLASSLKTCPPLIHAVLEYIIAPQCSPHSDPAFLSREFAINKDKFFKVLFNNPFIIQLFKYIPDEYEFNNKNNVINQKIIDIYHGFIYDYCNIFPNKLDSFIQILDAIPHPTLKKAVSARFLDNFYIFQHFNIHCWLPVYTLEQKFGLNGYYPRHYWDRATETLILQLIHINPQDLIDELKRKSVNFHPAFMDLLHRNPGWLNELSLNLDDLLDIYKAVFQVFKQNRPLVRLILSRIDHPYILQGLNLIR